MSEVQTTATGAFGDPTTGTVGPIAGPVVVPAGGRFLDLAAECEAHHSANNTNAFWFVLLLSQDGGAFVNMPTVYTTAWAYDDTAAGSQQMYGAAMDWGDATYRP